MKNIFTLLILPLSFQLAQAQSAKEIVDKSNQNMQGDTNESVMIMQIVRPEWTREISMKSWAKGSDYSLVLITAPARDQGAAFLKRKQELWNWQPTINRVIKMPPSMMMQSWMGSDFTNDDLVKQSSIADDYTHKILKDTSIDNRNVWKLELIPRKEAAVVWGKLEVYIDKQDYLQLLVKYYDEDDFLINTMIMSDIKAMGGRLIPARMEVIPAENPEQKTVILYESLKFNIPIDDNFFSLQNMKRIR